MLCVVAPLLQTLPVALLLVSTELLPAQKLKSPLIVGVAGVAPSVTVKFALVALQPFAPTVTEYVPPAVTVMLCVVSPPGLQTLAVAELLVKVMLLPAQRDAGPLIVGVAGLDTSLTVAVALVALQVPVVTVTE